MCPHVLHAHDVETESAVLCLEHAIEPGGRAFVRAFARHVVELWLQTELVFKFIVLVDCVRLNNADLSGTVGQIDQTFVTLPPGFPSQRSGLYLLPSWVAVHLGRQLITRPTRLHSSPIVSTLHTKPNVLVLFRLASVLSSQ